MTQNAARPERAIRSESHGPHWIAWIEDASGKPEQSIVMVGLTQEEAEERAKRWRDELGRSAT